MEPFPLMNDNITREDINAVIAFLETMPRLTQSARVAEFERAWSRWLGVKHSVYVNSGASANFVTIGAFRYLYGGGGEIIVPPLTWVSDISSVLLHGFTPVFADIDPRHLGMAEENPQVSPDFTFLVPSCNFRGTEIGGVLGLSQLKRLDENNRRRTENFHRFLKEIDPERFRTEFRVEGSSNYAFPLVIRQKDFAFRDRLEKRMREYRIEFRRGNAGGGNQLRQPYLKGIVPPDEYRKYPEVEHIHDFGYYIGNYPTLPPERVSELCRILNEAR